MMNNLFSALPLLLVASLLMVVFVSVGLARLFKAKRPFIWLAFLVVLLAIATGFGVHKYYGNDSIIILVSALAMYIVLLLLLIGMGLLDALVTSIANVAVMGLVLFAGGMALDRYQNSQLVDVMINYVKDNQSFISFSVFPETKQDEGDDVTDNKHEEAFVFYSETSLLPEGAMQQKNGLNSNTYQTVKLANAHTVKGKPVRVVKKDGEILKGRLVEIRKNSLVLSVYIPSAKGMIIAPIALPLIRKLEVYQ
jgi:hypothetical protein